MKEEDEFNIKGLPKLVILGLGLYPDRKDVIGPFELFPVHLVVPDGLTGHACPAMLD